MGQLAYGQACARHGDRAWWKSITIPVAGLAWLQDESLSSAVEGLLSCLTVSDPNEEGNPTCFVSAGFMSMMGVSEQECLGRNSNVLQVRARARQGRGAACDLCRAG